ncbi:MAG TPA: DUF3618 domain-containing protein [Ktedonobacterales bacterium]|nr:DUF3618 domain-containing protein [Ktedonobacterales bacterium]
MADTTTNSDTTDTNQSPDAIRDEIEQTRADMSETIDALQEKLDPQRIKARAVDSVKEKAQRSVQQAKQTVQAGAAQAKDTAAVLSAQAQQAIQQAPGTLQRLPAEAPDRLRALGNEAQFQATRTVDRVQRLRRDDPGAFRRLVIGAAAALGALVLLIIRIRAVRNRTPADTLTDNLSDTLDDGRATARKLKRVAGRAGRAARDEAAAQGLVSG